MTGEHVFPQWISRAFAPYFPYYKAVRTFGGVSQRPRYPSKLDAQAREVCGPNCNSGWMSRLEERMQPLLTPLMLGEDHRLLSIEDQRLIAVWATKTALMISLIGQKSGPGEVHRVSDEHYRRFYERREPLGLVFLAAYEGPTPTWFGQSDFWVRKDNPALAEGYCLTTQIGCLVFQIINGHGLQDADIRPDVGSRGNVIKIWPSTGMKRWPPLFALNEATLESFATALATEMEVVRHNPAP